MLNIKGKLEEDKKSISMAKEFWGWLIIAGHSNFIFMTNYHIILISKNSS